MANGKIETYIGFCLRARKITLGSGAIDCLKGGVYLLLMDGGSAQNSQKLAVKFKNKFSCPLVVCKEGFEKAVNKEGCRLAAVRDKELSKAILENLGGNYELYSGGNV